MRFFAYKAYSSAIAWKACQKDGRFALLMPSAFWISPKIRISLVLDVKEIAFVV